MKKFGYSALFLALTFVQVGCGEPAETPATPTPAVAPAGADVVAPAAEGAAPAEAPAAEGAAPAEAPAAEGAAPAEAPAAEGAAPAEAK